MKKTVIITGAAGGIGRATAELFAAHHCNVLITNIGRGRRRPTTLPFLTEQELSVELLKADVTRRPEVEAMVAFCQQRFGQIDLSDQ